jgi:8-oxo-dGTP pyrophosphatase MutT (NUDIX family)
LKRNQLLSLLTKYQPTAEEIEFKEKTIQFVKEHEDCFERSLLIGHITASAWLLNRNESKALLMHHTKLDRWFQLGGHCDGDSDTLAVAIKEAQEESGINGIVAITSEIFDIDIHQIPEHKGIPAHLHYDIRFLLKVDSNEIVVQNVESKELRWIEKNLKSLPSNERSVVRMFEKWKAL